MLCITLKTGDMFITDKFVVKDNQFILSDDVIIDIVDVYDVYDVDTLASSYPNDVDLASSYPNSRERRVIL